MHNLLSLKAKVCLTVDGSTVAVQFILLIETTLGMPKQGCPSSQADWGEGASS